MYVCIPAVVTIDSQLRAKQTQARKCGFNANKAFTVVIASLNTKDTILPQLSIDEKQGMKTDNTKLSMRINTSRTTNIYVTRFDDHL